MRTVLWVVLFAAVVAAPCFAADRPQAVADRFYPADAMELSAEVDSFLAQAHAARGERPIALVAPHAGYVYCGAILGEAYRQIQGQDYDLVVLLGTNHTRTGLAKAAVWPDGSWGTPLGFVRVDEKAVEVLRSVCDDCVVDAEAHTAEHSIEVQLPFLQKVLPGVPIVPITVGAEDPFLPERVGRAVAFMVRGRRALIVASSDLSHYPGRRDAVAVDNRTLDAIATLDAAAVRKTISTQMSRRVPGLVTCACGEAPVLTMLAAVKSLGPAHAAVVAYANSADVPLGDSARAVGYGAVAVVAGSPPPVKAEPRGSLDLEQRRALLDHAREAIHRRFEGGPPPALRDPALRVKRGAFVTLEKSGELRGCIGHMAEDVPLAECVERMALAAAFEDHRFPPLEREELARVTIEISVLTPARAVKDAQAIVIGRDGVILRKDGRSAVFLPQVAAEQGWDRETMLSQLARKAGLPADAWRSGAEFLTFQAEVFGEADLLR